MPLPYTSLLRGRRVLVVEDSYLIAEELSEALEREGAEVVGPVSALEDAWDLAQATPDLDAAVLDVRLRGEMVWPLADFLSRRDVRLVFATGYASRMVQGRYRQSQVVEKPIPARAIVRLLSAERPRPPAALPPAA